MKTWVGAAWVLGAFVAACGSGARDLEPPDAGPPDTSAGPPAAWTVTAGATHEARSTRFVVRGETGAFVHVADGSRTQGGRVLGGGN